MGKIDKLFLPISHLLLKRQKGAQAATFKRLSEKVPTYFELLSKQDISQFTTPTWNEMNAKIRKELLPIPIDFLRHPTILYTMFVQPMDQMTEEQLDLIQEQIPEGTLKKVLAEDWVGRPRLWSNKYRTSQNAIHQLYHLSYFLKRTGVRLESIGSVVEWGGGYGCFARGVLRLRENTPFTYTLIDTPFFCCLQWLYLSCIFGEERTNLLLSGADEIIPGKINILTPNLLVHQNVKADLFVSAWALSESSPFSQEYVADHNFFGARHFLLGYRETNRDFIISNKFVALAEKKASYKDELPFLEKNYYLLR